VQWWHKKSTIQNSQISYQVGCRKNKDKSGKIETTINLYHCARKFSKKVLFATWKAFQIGIGKWETFWMAFWKAKFMGEKLFLLFFLCQQRDRNTITLWKLLSIHFNL